MVEFWNVFMQSFAEEMRAGKYLGLIIVGVMLLWLLGKYRKQQGTKLLLLYGITICLAVAVPLGGYVLAKFQTAFFSYRHLLLLLFPMIFIPWALVEALETGLGLMKRNAEEGDMVREKPWVSRFLGVIVATTLLMLSGNMLTEGVDTEFTLAKEKVPTRVMEVLELLEKGDVLVAPNEVLEYARSYDGDLKLIYGRDMWQPALRAYTYHSYDEATCQIYEWMQNEPLNYFNVSEEDMDSIQMEEDQAAFQLIASTACNTLVLPHAMYERVWTNLGPEGMKGFEMEEETTEYVVLVRK